MEDMPKLEDIVQLEALPIPIIELTSEFETCVKFTQRVAVGDGEKTFWSLVKKAMTTWSTRFFVN